MSRNAYGPATFRAKWSDYSTYSPGQGKDFQKQHHLPSVGSVNRFSRRAIARRASRRIGFECANGGSCGCPTNETLNLVNGKLISLIYFLIITHKVL